MDKKNTVRTVRPEPTNKEKIYEYIKKMIDEGVFRPGQSLRIAELAESLKVSQTPVREALILLEGESLVDFRPYKGAIVKGLSRSELKEIFKIRIILENAAIDFAFPHFTPELLAKAREMINSAGAQEREYFSALNWSFHELLIKQAKMPILHGIINSLSARVQRYTRVYYLAEPQRFASDHLLQIECYERGDLEGAKALHKRQIERVVALISPLLPE